MHRDPIELLKGNKFSLTGWGGRQTRKWHTTSKYGQGNEFTRTRALAKSCPRWRKMIHSAALVVHQLPSLTRITDR